VLPQCVTWFLTVKWLVVVVVLIAQAALWLLARRLLNLRTAWHVLALFGMWMVFAAVQLAVIGCLRSLIYPLFDDKELILRMVFAAVTSFLIMVLLSPAMIRFLVREKLGDRAQFNNALLDKANEHKNATPTMGGALICIAIIVSVLLLGDWGSMYVRMSIFVTVWLGALGLWDDWTKLHAPPKKPAAPAAPGASTAPTAPAAPAAPNAAQAKLGGKTGLRMWQKILFQFALGMLLAFFIFDHGRQSEALDYKYKIVNAAHCFYFPFKADPITLALPLYVILTVLVIVGSSNAVNLTDGMDGLASGCMIIVTAVFAVLAWVAGNYAWATFMHLPFVPQAAELTVVCAAMAGSCLGFLWFNAQPAEVFMGDTGSLPLGGLIGYIAVVTRHELILFIAGGVFVMEAFSVASQVLYFKASHGKRIFRCAPIHHHFHMSGWEESKVVIRFWLLGIIFAALALATLKLR
jgi:phospho-N-acetylmuramoyl-pentapeptide-transferase